MSQDDNLPPHLEGIEGPCADAVVRMEERGRFVHVVGRIVNGRVEIDEEQLNEMAARYPNATMSFVAVNAPFDPQARA